MRASVALGVLLVACGEPSPSTGQDAAASDGAAPDARITSTSSVVEIGTGADRYLALTAGQQIALDVGPQGGGRYFGYHIWGALQQRGLAPVGAEVNFSVIDAENGELYASQTRTGVTMQPTGGGSYAVYGIAARLTDCCLVQGREVILRGWVEDAAGIRGENEVRVRAAPACPPSPGIPGPVCP